MGYLSYFAGGALEGAGKGLAGEGAVQESVQAKRELQKDKLDADLQRQRERAQDKQDQMLFASILKGDSGGGGGKGGPNLFTLAQQADTPEKQTSLVETVRAFGGDDAANVIGRIFNRGDTQTVNPTTGDFARFDRTVDDNGQSAAPVPASFVQRAQYDAEKGRTALQRVMAMVMDPGKYDDFTKGERTAYGTDLVRGATNDQQVRQAGARIMAVEGKDRFGVQGDQLVDKAEGTVKQTDLGNAKATDERASAGEHSAKAKKVGQESTVDPKELETLQQMRKTAEEGLRDARKALTEFDKTVTTTTAREKRAPERKQLVDEVTAKRAELDEVSRRLTARLDRAAGGTTAPADAPQAMPAEKAKLVKGRTYNTSRGPARWNGAVFEAL
jgi:hypothetical protein